MILQNPSASSQSWSPRAQYRKADCRTLGMGCRHRVTTAQPPLDLDPFSGCLGVAVVFEDAETPARTLESGQAHLCADDRRNLGTSATPAPSSNQRPKTLLIAFRSVAGLNGLNRDAGEDADPSSQLIGAFPNGRHGRSPAISAPSLSGGSRGSARSHRRGRAAGACNGSGLQASGQRSGQDCA